MASGDSVMVVVPSDEEYLRIEDSLAQEGIQALPATCLLQAVLQQVSAPALVIIYDTDVRESWRLALQQFLSLQPGARVVFLSRLADDRMWMDVLDSGGYDLVMKPFQAEELLVVVRSALSHAFRSAA